MSESMRYKLIRTRGTRHPVVYFEGESREYAEHFADAYGAEADCRVLLCEAPEGGLVRALGTFGPKPEEKPKQVRRA